MVWFSIIIPVYNKEKHLNRCFESLFNQTYQNFEVVVVCDPSTDKSIEVIESIESPKLRRFYRASPGPGGYAARNLGIKNSIYKWILFLDADDVYDKYYLEKLADTIKNNSDISIFSSAQLIVARDSEKLDLYAEKFGYKGSHEINFQAYLSHCILGERMISTNTICVDRALIEGYDFFPEGRTARSGDLYTWAKLLAKNKKFLWSPYISSRYYTDADNRVSQSAIPSMTLPRELVSEVEIFLNNDELNLLKSYANELIANAYKEQVRLSGRPSFSLWETLYMSRLTKRTAFWLFISLLNNSILSKLLNSYYNRKHKASNG